MMKLKGYVKSETNKAILFEITSDENGFHLEGQTEWFPISHTRLPKKLYGKEISIYVHNWLYDSKIHVDEGEK